MSQLSLQAMQQSYFNQLLRGNPAHARSEANQRNGNFFKRMYDKAKEKLENFKREHYDLLLNVGKATSIVAGLQATRYILVKFT